MRAAAQKVRDRDRPRGLPGEKGLAFATPTRLPRARALRRGVGGARGAALPSCALLRESGKRRLPRADGSKARSRAARTSAAPAPQRSRRDQRARATLRALSPRSSAHCRPRSPASRPVCIERTKPARRLHSPLLHARGRGRRYFAKSTSARSSTTFAAEGDACRARRRRAGPARCAEGGDAQFFSRIPGMWQAEITLRSGRARQVHSARGEFFGWRRDNYIGRTPQLNRRSPRGAISAGRAASAALELGRNGLGASLSRGRASPRGAPRSFRANALRRRSCTAISGAQCELVAGAPCSSTRPLLGRPRRTWR